MTKKQVVTLHLAGTVIRTTADHRLYVRGRGWIEAGELEAGDRVRTHDGQDVPIEAITRTGGEQALYQMDASVPPLPCVGLWSAGTLLETADGLKPIEDIKVGDRVVVRDPLDPERN